MEDSAVNTVNHGGAPGVAGLPSHSVEESETSSASFHSAVDDSLSRDTNCLVTEMEVEEGGNHKHDSNTQSNVCDTNHPNSDDNVLNQELDLNSHPPCLSTCTAVDMAIDASENTKDDANDISNSAPTVLSPKHISESSINPPQLASADVDMAFDVSEENSDDLSHVEADQKQELGIKLPHLSPTAAVDVAIDASENTKDDACEPNLKQVDELSNKPPHPSSPTAVDVVSDASENTKGDSDNSSNSEPVVLSQKPGLSDNPPHLSSTAVDMAVDDASPNTDDNANNSSNSEPAVLSQKPGLSDNPPHLSSTAVDMAVDVASPNTEDNTKPLLLEPLPDEQRAASPLSPTPPDTTAGCPTERETLSLSLSVLDEGVGGEERELVTPSVSSSGYGGSREASPEDGVIITEDMKAEEERLRERESREQSFEGEAGELTHMKEYQRYMRLQHLLQKSSIYSKFLLERMENQIEENKKSTAKGKKKDQTTASGKKRVSGEAKATRQSPRRKSSRATKRKADDAFQLSHYMDGKGKLKQMKLDKGGGVTQAVEAAGSKRAAAKDEKPEEKERYIKGVSVPAAQPGLMTGGVMRSYQVEGMEWIKVLYENGVNGILADEMGLGKTLQVIAVIAHLIEMGVKGPFLVAAPLSTLPNWVSEFKKFTPEIPVILYHGTQMEREKLRRKMFRRKKKAKELDTLPVVVTSYEICMRDQRHLMYRNWRFLVVDEGHRIKNLNCKLIRSLKAYDAANRLLLTGTPLQNNLAELWSLLNFILPDIFDDLNGFQSWFDFDVNGEDNREKIIAQEREQNVLSTLHQILTPFLLRRLKTDVEFSLPPKKEVLVYAPLTTLQQKYYTSLLDRTILEMMKGKGSSTVGVSEVEEGKGGSRTHRARKSRSGYAQLDDDQFESLLTGEKSYEDLVTPSDAAQCQQPTATRTSATNIKLTNVWMMLRKCCNHPYLLEFPMTPDGQFRVDEELVTSCGKLMLLDRLLSALVSRGHKTIVFSQFTSMLDILEDYLELRSMNYGRLDGQMAFSERQRQMAVFQGDPDCHVFLTSTRAGGLGINLTAADTVIIYDSDWNPQADLQAQDRCHRIGQTKPVMVYRLVTANTFDQRIVERATSKRRLEKMIIHKGKFKGYSGEDQQLSLEDLASLLHSVDHEKVVDSNDAIISDEALEALLDRNIQMGKEGGGGVGGGGKGERGEGQHEGVFKVIDEQDSSGNTLLSINKCNTSDQISQSSIVTEDTESDCSHSIKPNLCGDASVSVTVTNVKAA